MKPLKLNPILIKSIVLGFLLSWSTYSCGQEEESIQDYLTIVDSNLYNGEMIYVFGDKSWEYKKNYKVVVNYRTIERNGCIYFDSLELVSKNFITTRTHSNLYNLSGLSDSVIIDISGYCNPVIAPLTSGFKLRWGRWHKGNDLGCPTGTPIVSSWDGIVRYAQYNEGGYGNLIIVRHFNGLETYYAHLSAKLVSVGQKVAAGQIIGHSGNTGHSKGPHLHYEVRFLENAFDPQNIKGDRLIICKNLFLYLGPGKKIVLKEILGSSIKQENEIIEEKKVEIKRKKRKTSSNFGQ